MERETEPRFETRSVSTGEDPAETSAGDVTVPIHLASTYTLPGIDSDLSLEDVDPDRGEYLYGRLSNPTRHAAEKRIASLERADHGFCFASGSAAIATTFLATVEPGDHVVAFDDLYAGTTRMLTDFFEKQLNVRVTSVDATDPGNVEAAIQPETKLVWMESPTNPSMRICDLSTIANVAHENDALLGVDNTFLSPYFQQPLSLGADVVAHSTTKYLNGHSDSIGGAVVTDHDTVAEEMKFLQQIALGNQMPPFDAYLLLRGTKTLSARMRDHEANALVIAEYLEDHDAVDTVHYPGLESHPQHDLSERQQSGYGGILSFDIQGDQSDAIEFLESLSEFSLAVSVGGVESLIQLPAAMTHEPLGAETRSALGITDTLIRMSVGIEHIDDLVADLDDGFASIAQ
ncbi:MULTISPECIES: trans-sulfuration enzyme family protein [Halococcus]|uniref:Cystathionine synthase/lyase n=1 Tax=Halococcus salifodinae DSM 8989 TaxID=1227456 RepID=M0MY16_9EURY|nr:MULTISPECIES: PLP-dependent aspartate aminotransferase family protein [Halococcus]EMA49315.1 cystathionine synthase/lyase [Halococcus salifodinae DSM 8989]